MFVSNQRPLPGIVFVAAVAAMIASWAEVADAIEWTKMYIPYNGMDEKMFGDHGPYKYKDPLRQHLHLFQTPSNEPTPVYLFSHSDGATPFLSEAQMKKIASTGYSIISWEAETTITTGTMGTCWSDFEKVWSWLNKNAASYNLDPGSVVIGGRSRGSMCSWPLAHSQKPAIKGIYMYNALPDPAWDHKAKNGPSYVWDQAVTVNSPPAYLVYGPECPKPIKRNCVPSPKKKHNPWNGQKIVDLYNKLGIGSTIQLTDGLLNNGIGAHDFFPEFVASLPSYRGPAKGSSSTGSGGLGSSDITSNSHSDTIDTPDLSWGSSDITATSHSSTSGTIDTPDLSLGSSDITSTLHSSTPGTIDTPDSSHSSVSSSACKGSSSACMGSSATSSGEEEVNAANSSESSSGSLSFNLSDFSGDLSEEDKMTYLMIGIGCGMCMLLYYIMCTKSDQLNEEDDKLAIAVDKSECQNLLMSDEESTLADTDEPDQFPDFSKYGLTQNPRPRLTRSASG